MQHIMLYSHTYMYVFEKRRPGKRHSGKSIASASLQAYLHKQKGAKRTKLKLATTQLKGLRAHGMGGVPPNQFSVQDELPHRHFRPVVFGLMLFFCHFC